MNILIDKKIKTGKQLCDEMWFVYNDAGVETAIELLSYKGHEVIKMYIDHPDFKRFFEKGWAEKLVIIFERTQYKEPSKKQAEQYQKNAEIVRSLGGIMKLSWYQIAGENPVLTQNDVYEMLRAVRNHLPLSRYIYKFWNGAGSYSLSVSIGEVNNETDK